MGAGERARPAAGSATRARVPDAPRARTACRCHARTSTTTATRSSCGCPRPTRSSHLYVPRQARSNWLETDIAERRATSHIADHATATLRRRSAADEAQACASKLQRAEVDRHGEALGVEAVRRAEPLGLRARAVGVEGDVDEALQVAALGDPDRVLELDERGIGDLDISATCALVLLGRIDRLDLSTLSSAGRTSSAGAARPSSAGWPTSPWRRRAPAACGSSAWTSATSPRRSRRPA